MLSVCCAYLMRIFKRHTAFGAEIHVCVVTKGYSPDSPEEELELKAIRWI